MFMVKKVTEDKTYTLKSDLVEVWILYYNSQFSSLIRQHHSILHVLQKGNFS